MSITPKRSHALATISSGTAPAAAAVHARCRRLLLCWLDDASSCRGRWADRSGCFPSECWDREFADSKLEGSGFELAVPLGHVPQTRPLDHRVGLYIDTGVPSGSARRRSLWRVLGDFRANRLAAFTSSGLCRRSLSGPRCRAEYVLAAISGASGAPP
jgi:hypothetical protein